MKSSKEENKAPWLNTDGTIKTNEEIAELGKSWSSTTWERYLDTEVGTLQDDQLLFFENMDTEEVLDKSSVLKCLQETRCYEEIEIALLIALDKLSKKEKFIIKESFWQSTSDLNIAKKIKTSHESVRVLKSRAIKKLGKILSSKQLKNEISDLKFSQQLKTLIYWKKKRITSDSLTFR